jgi:hypothetical protein
VKDTLADGHEAAQVPVGNRSSNVGDTHEEPGAGTEARSATATSMEDQGTGHAVVVKPDTAAETKEVADEAEAEETQTPRAQEAGKAQ